MTSKEKLILLLDDMALSYKTICFFYENFSYEDLNSNIDKIKNEIIKNVGDGVFLKLKNANLDLKLEKIMQNLQKYDIKPIFYENPEYPNLLKNISNPPMVLYTKGDISLLNKKSISIVGTRRPTTYGREVTKHFAVNLTKAGLITVSGLAYGLDMEVALSTLESRGKTIAVLGGGLDKIYPEQNTSLANKIVENGGLLLSLFPPLRRPTKYSFVDRNRIISALSLGTIIVEAGESSGTLNTANHAIEQGKELFVVPGSIFSKSCIGSNRLIQELPETYTSSVEHVLKVLGINYKENNEQKTTEIIDNSKLILNLLYEGEKDFDELKEKTNLDSKSLITLLTRMEISGLIKKLPNNIYSI